MVAPAEDAVDCAECHAEEGRMADLAGIYLPGADTKAPGGLLGMLAVILALLGVAGHGALRLFTRKSKEG